VRRQQTGFRTPFSYFHNGFAADLDAVVAFYDTRFTIGLSAQDKADLAAFLRSL
jgi:cytochrome c peroxidase